MRNELSNEQIGTNQFTFDWSDPEKVWEEVQRQRQENKIYNANTHNNAENYVAPGTPTEVEVAKIWSKFLGAEKIGIHDGFTKLGGHSLMVMEILARIQEVFHVQIPMAAFFSDTDFTVEALSKIIDEYQIKQSNNDDIESLTKEIDQLSDEEIKKLLEEEMKNNGGQE